MGELIITDNPEDLSLLGLGSCIGLIVYDSNYKLFAVAHTMLPEIHAYKDRPGIFDPTLPAKFTDVAVKLIVKKFRDNGIGNGNLRAKLVGGGQIFERDIIRVGEKNIASVKNELQEEGVKIEQEVVGGNQGVSVLHIGKNAIMDVKKDGKIFQI